MSTGSSSLPVFALSFKLDQGSLFCLPTLTLGPTGARGNEGIRAH